MRRWLAVSVLFALAFVVQPPLVGAVMGAAVEAAAQAAERTVIFNTKSRIYHHAGCNAALACTVNCITVPLAEALRRGGRPCGRCGG